MLNSKTQRLECVRYVYIHNTLVYASVRADMRSYCVEFCCSAKKPLNVVFIWSMSCLYICVNGCVCLFVCVWFQHCTIIFPSEKFLCLLCFDATDGYCPLQYGNNFGELSICTPYPLYILYTILIH